MSCTDAVSLVTQNLMSARLMSPRSRIITKRRVLMISAWYLHGLRWEWISNCIKSCFLCVFVFFFFCIERYTCRGKKRGKGVTGIKSRGENNEKSKGTEREETRRKTVVDKEEDEMEEKVLTEN